LAAGVLAGCSDSPPEAATVGEIRGTPISVPVGQASSNTPGATIAAASLKAPVPGSGPIAVGFDQLAGYHFEVSDALMGPVTNDAAWATVQTDAQIPERVRALNERNVAIKGVMLPLKVDGGVVTEMLIMKDQSMCCYGTTPRINEWVSVKMRGKGVKPIMDQPVTLFGTLHVGETRENGYLVGIYRLDGNRMEAPED